MIKEIAIYIEKDRPIVFQVGKELINQEGKPMRKMVIKIACWFNTAKIFLSDGQRFVYKGFKVSYVEE